MLSTLSPMLTPRISRAPSRKMSDESLNKEFKQELLYDIRLVLKKLLNIKKSLRPTISVEFHFQLQEDHKGISAQSIFTASCIKS